MGAFDKVKKVFRKDPTEKTLYSNEVLESRAESDIQRQLIAFLKKIRSLKKAVELRLSPAGWVVNGKLPSILRRNKNQTKKPKKRIEGTGLYKKILF